MNIEQIVAEMRQKIASRPVRDEDGFSESEYLELHPDVGNAVAAVAAGTYGSGNEHWTRFGRAKRIAGLGLYAHQRRVVLDCLTARHDL